MKFLAWMEQPQLSQGPEQALAQARRFKPKLDFQINSDPEPGIFWQARCSIEARWKGSEDFLRNFERLQLEWPRLKLGSGSKKNQPHSSSNLSYFNQVRARKADRHHRALAPDASGFGRVGLEPVRPVYRRRDLPRSLRRRGAPLQSQNYLCANSRGEATP